MTDASHLSITQVEIAGAKSIGKREEIVQEATENSMKSFGDNVFFAVRRNFDTLEKRTLSPKQSGAKESEEADKVSPILEVQSIEETAEQYQKKNPELLARSLLNLRVRITSSDSREEILSKLQESYPDPFLANDALDFLIETSTGELAEKLAEAKKKFLEMYGREVLAGKNISLQAREFSKQGLGSPTNLRELYKDVTQNPRDAATLFSDLTKKYDFNDLKTVIAFVLHSLGSDLKSKGSSIEKGELFTLISEAKSMQAILGVYRFFKSRMRLVLSSFEKEDLVLPSRVTFESLSKMFISFLLERFPSADKVLQAGLQMGLEGELLAELIIFSQMRDAVRQVSPRLFKSEQHRQDTLAIFLEALEKLEEELDEEEEEEESE